MKAMATTQREGDDEGCPTHPRQKEMIKGREESVQRIDYGMREFIILKEEASVVEDAANTGS